MSAEAASRRLMLPSPLALQRRHEMAQLQKILCSEKEVIQAVALFSLALTRLRPAHPFWQAGLFIHTGFVELTLRQALNKF